MTLVALILLLSGLVLMYSGIEHKTIATTVTDLLGGNFHVRRTSTG